MDGCSEEPEIQLQIIKSNKTFSDISTFEPQTQSSNEAPEKKLTLVALRLALLEKTATGLGTLGFIWATVVLLGGFAATLDGSDFWFITVILLIEGGRIFGRSQELEWQHQATWSIKDVGVTSFRVLKSRSDTVWKGFKSIFGFRMANGNRRIKDETAKRERHWANKTRGIKRLPSRRWETSEVPIMPYFSWVFISRNISKILQWIQIMAAITCVILSTIKIVRRNFGGKENGDSAKRNRESALLIFYALAFAEASLFLIEKLYWEIEVRYCNVLERISKECEFDNYGIVSIKRFFYDAYSKCVQGSIFDGLKMDMVSFGIELLSSNSPEEQLMGARILESFSKSERFSDDTLQKLGTSLSAVLKLVEMVSWKDVEDEQIRHSSAVILLKLAGKKQNSLRVAGIPGSIESISSLLYVSRISGEKSDEWTFHHLGLLILKKLARDHDNCWKIGNTGRLLLKIIEFTCVEEAVLKDENVTGSRILIVRKSLQVLKLLACSTGDKGKRLRREISEIVFTVSNIRVILRHGQKHPNLQILGIEILTSLAMEDDATEKIGGTGGILRELLNIFLLQSEESDARVRTSAGEALVMLALESNLNCQRILKLRVLGKIVQALEVPLLQVNAARLLSNLCTYTAQDYSVYLRRTVTDVLPVVLKMIISEEDELQEVMIGLAARAFKLTTSEESNTIFLRAEMKQSELAEVLIQILKKHQYPPARYPRIRRFVIELVIWMMQDKETNIGVFRNLVLENELENVLDTTSEVENYNVFSGTVGLSRCKVTIQSLVETVLNLIASI